MSTRDIQHHVKEIYNHDISPETVSRITDAVIDKAKEWHNRPLEPISAIVFMDALFLKLRVDGRVKNVAAYLMVGIDLEGRKECLGIWLGQSESAKYWLGVLNEFKNRDVNDVLIFAVDGLTGFPEAIRAVYPQAEIQRGLVHQVRNSLAQMAWKDRKEVASCLRSIYTAPTEEAGHGPGRVRGSLEAEISPCRAVLETALAGTGDVFQLSRSGTTADLHHQPR
jgi:transposase-like protein